MKDGEKDARVDRPGDDRLGEGQPREVHKVLNSPFSPEVLDRLDSRFFDENKASGQRVDKDLDQAVAEREIISQREFVALLENPSSASSK